MITCAETSATSVGLKDWHSNSKAERNELLTSEDRLEIIGP